MPFYWIVFAFCPCFDFMCNTSVMLRDTAGEKCKNLLILSFFCFLTPPSLRATSPIAHTCAEEEVNAFLLNCLCFLLLLRFYVQHSRNATGHGRGGGEILLTNILTLQYISFGVVGAWTSIKLKRAGSCSFWIDGDFNVPVCMEWKIFVYIWFFEYRIWLDVRNRNIGFVLFLFFPCRVLR